MARVLLVDDEPAVLFALKEVVRAAGHEPVLARSGKEALEQLEGVDAVVTDFAMPEMDGLALLAAIRERDQTLPVILLTAQGSERVAVRAMKAGAYDYVTKPFDIDEMTLVVERALETRGLRVQNRRLAAERAIGKPIVGETPAMRRLLDAAARVAPKDVTVLVRGETGTGKELVASLLHAQSRRAAGPLVRFNCAAIPGELAEAELFGHARGAFTGAVQARRGFFAQATAGRWCSTRSASCPPRSRRSSSARCRRGRSSRSAPGASRRSTCASSPAPTATSRPRCEAGRFREDLYYRARGRRARGAAAPRAPRRHPGPRGGVRAPLRASGSGSDGVRLSPALVERLRAADWPGNVRQLENAVARMVALSATGELGPEALDERAAAVAGEVGDEGEAEAEAIPAAEGMTLREQLDALERNVIAKTLSATGGNQSEAARRLGVSRTAFIDRLRKYGLS